MIAFKHFLKENSFYLVFTIMFSLVLLPMNIKPIAIALFSISIITHSIIKKNKFNWRYFIINSLFYLFLFITLFYSSTIKKGVLNLQTMVSLLLFPLLFSLISKQDYFNLYKKKKKLFIIYVASVITFNLTVLIWFSITEFTFFSTIKHFNEIINSRLGKFNIHPIYLSIHICISILFCFWVNTEKKSLLTITLTPFLIFFLLIILKKGPILSLIVSFVYILFFVLRGKQKIIGLTFFILSITLLFSLPKTKEKFIELIKIKELTDTTISSTNIRASIYKSSIKPIKNSFFFGYGIGDHNEVLKKNYNNTILILGGYNSHNQYISIMLIGGVTLLIVFFVTNFYNINLAFRNNNHLFIIVNIFFLLNMFTESILERESGVIFYSFFSCFLNLKNYFNKH